MDGSQHLAGSVGEQVVDQLKAAVAPDAGAGAELGLAVGVVDGHLPRPIARGQIGHQCLIQASGAVEGGEEPGRVEQTSAQARFRGRGGLTVLAGRDRDGLTHGGRLAPELLPELAAHRDKLADAERRQRRGSHHGDPDEAGAPAGHQLDRHGAHTCTHGERDAHSGET